MNSWVLFELRPMYIMIPIVAARWTGGKMPLKLAMAVARAKWDGPPGYGQRV